MLCAPPSCEFVAGPGGAAVDAVRRANAEATVWALTVRCEAMRTIPPPPSDTSPRAQPKAADGAKTSAPAAEAAPCEPPAPSGA